MVRTDFGDHGRTDVPVWYALISTTKAVFWYFRKKQTEQVEICGWLKSFSHANKHAKKVAIQVERTIKSKTAL